MPQRKTLLSALALAAGFIASAGEIRPAPGEEQSCQEIADAYRETSATRVRTSLNGLWQFHPVKDASPSQPKDGWTWGKIPAVWPGSVGDRAWYRRTFMVPEGLKGRRVAVAFGFVNTHADVYVDGRKAGGCSFPCGEVDVTDLLRPGTRQELAIDVTAFPQSRKTLDYNAPDRAEWRAAEVKCRGLTGDLWLVATPEKRVTEAWCETSVENGEITFVAETTGFSGTCDIEATVDGCGSTKRFAGRARRGVDGRLRLTAAWRDAKLWDVHTPGNMYACRLNVKDDSGATDETTPFRFGFREVKVSGRDLLLNGTPIHLRALHNVTMNGSGEFACRESAVKACRRMKGEGFNFIIAGNYDYRAGCISYPDGLLEACDETGMLLSYTLPHFRDFDSKLDDPDVARRYRDLAEKAISIARGHPSVVTYATSHNATGYVGDMNPLRIDGVYDPGDTGRLANRAQAKRARQLIREVDATRPCYHHESGNLDDFHTVNIYLNWAPRQERSDWLRHWSEAGVKPLFFVEWGMPHVASWSSYRGPMFIWRNPAYHMVWGAEYAAAIRGDAAYEGDWKTARAIRVEEDLWKAQHPFMYSRASWAAYEIEGNFQGVMADYAQDVWRSHRAWGVTAMLPWDQEMFFKRVKGEEREANPKALTDLKRPGLVADEYVSHRQYWLDPFKWDRFRATSVQQAFRRWNRDDCAFIGGADVFTDKRHHYRPGERAAKTLVILNDRRVAQSVGWACSLADGSGKVLEKLDGTVSVAPGGRVDVPVAFTLPAAGEYSLAAEFGFAGGSRQTDSFRLAAVPDAKPSVDAVRLYDPKGLTSAHLARLGVPCAAVAPEEAAKLGRGARLVVGREALTRELLSGVLVPVAEKGGRVVVFEQTASTLESCGFRVQEYGLRQAFPRYRRAGLECLSQGAMRDWAGESTLVAPHLENLAEIELDYPATRWCGYPNTRVWRCGNRGAVATVVPEKPTRGSWRALADGMFDLQYAPLLEWRVAEGAIVFCQFDVTARTVADPFADELTKALMTTLASPPERFGIWPKALGREACLAAMARGLRCNHSDGGGSAYLVSSGAQMPADFLDRIAGGAKAVCCGFTAEEIGKWSPVKLPCENRMDATYGRIAEIPPELNGLSNADWAPRAQFACAVFTEKTPDGNPFLRVVRHGKGTIVFWQVPPWAMDDTAKPYLRSSRRRAEYMLSHFLDWMNVYTPERMVCYADAPIPEDDPYRYYRW